MRRTVDYKKSPAPAFDAVQDIIEYLGVKKYRHLIDVGGIGRVTDVRQFSFYCMIAGIDGFPVQAWYENFHGQGSWDKAWDIIEGEKSNENN